MVKLFLASNDSHSSSSSPCQMCHQNTSSSDLSDTAYVVYGCVMFVVLSLGLVGNLLTILVLRHREHRDKTVVPFLLNLSLADIFIICISFSSTVNALVTPRSTMSRGPFCSLYAIVDGVFECASIASLCALSIMMYWGVVISRYNTTSKKITMFGSTLMVISTWVYALTVASPPLLGWGSFVPGSDEIMCTLDWASQEWKSLSYNIFLLLLSFFVPLVIIFCCYGSTYRYMHRPIIDMIHSLQRKHIHNERIIVRITLLVVSAFIISWLPRCLINLVAMFKGEVISGRVSLTAEAFSKACVIYNPCIYFALNKRFRLTLKNMMPCNQRRTRQVSDVSDRKRATTESAMADPAPHTSSMTMTV